MPPKKYESNQLYSIIDSLFEQKKSGILSLKTQISSLQIQRSGILVLRNGASVYGDLGIAKPPNNKELCKMLGDNLKPNLINAALSVASEKIENPQSTRELVELLSRMRVFTWQEIETFITNKVLLTLEKFVFNPGIALWQESDNFDLDYGVDNHGLNWSEIKKQLARRQQQWSSYEAHIPSMNAIPIVTPEQLKQVSNSQVKEHFRSSADGTKTLIDIAEKMGKDPLIVAKNYYNWASNGWVNFVQSPVARTVSQTVTAPKLVTPQLATPVASKPQGINNLPTVLSVDDSPIIQTTIKRALQEQYNVLLADKAAEALKILNQHPVHLLLLDLTMPEIDGLQFCKTIRQIPKFQNLPIVMVTARDGLVNKAKGHLAGTSKYLTKPFKPDELREVVRQYISK